MLVFLFGMLCELNYNAGIYKIYKYIIYKISFNYLDIKYDDNIQNGVLRKFLWENHKSSISEKFSSCSFYVLFHIKKFYTRKW